MDKPQEKKEEEIFTLSEADKEVLGRLHSHPEDDPERRKKLYPKREKPA